MLKSFFKIKDFIDASDRALAVYSNLLLVTAVIADHKI